MKPCRTLLPSAVEVSNLPNNRSSVTWVLEKKIHLGEQEIFVNLSHSLGLCVLTVYSSLSLLMHMGDTVTVPKGVRSSSLWVCKVVIRLGYQMVNLIFFFPLV